MPATRRSTRPEKSEWAAMPRHLLISILENAHDAYMLESGSYNKLQLVCKSWRAAVLEHLSEVDNACIRMKHPSELPLACKMLPGISHLRIWKEGEYQWLPLDSLSALSRLVSINLQNNAPPLGRPTVRLDQLPSQLQSLHLRSFEMAITSLESSTFSHLTELCYHWGSRPEVDVLGMLRCLPALKVLEIGCTEHDAELASSQGPMDMFLGLPTLTSLSIWAGEFKAPFTAAAVEAQNLQKLSLQLLETSAKHLQQLCFLLPSITRICLQACEDVWSHDPDLGPPPNLRALTLMSMHPSSFMTLAGPQLESLFCLDQKQMVLEPAISSIALLTGLTRLELASYPCIADFSPLHGLGLVELVLIDCPYIPQGMFSRGAFTSLQKLHIADQDQIPSSEDFHRDLQTPGCDGYVVAHQLLHLGAIVLGLPNLREISGLCSLLMLGMADALSASGWHKGPYEPRTVAKLNWHNDAYTWTLPQ